MCWRTVGWAKQRNVLSIPLLFPPLRNSATLTTSIQRKHRLILPQTVQAFLPNMIQQNHGHIVALSSIAGFIGLANVVPYCASKFAVRGNNYVPFRFLLPLHEISPRLLSFLTFVGLMEGLNEELRTMNKEKISNINFTTIYPYMVDTGLCKKPRIRYGRLERATGKTRLTKLIPGWIIEIDVELLHKYLLVALISYNLYTPWTKLRSTNVVEEILRLNDLRE